MTMSQVENPLSELFHYNAWANLQLLDACQALSAEQLAASAPGTYGSIHATLAHIVGGEEDYLAVLTGVQPADPIREDEPPSVAVLRDLAASIGEELAQAASQVGIHDTFPRQFDGQIYDLPAPRFLVQILSHSSEHRTHVTTIMSQHGFDAPNIEGWTYMHVMGIAPRP